MQLSPNFTLEEATVSQTAARYGIKNEPSPEMVVEIRKTAYFLEKVRSCLFSKPIIVTSWYRCLELEKIITGNPHSSGHHPLGAAVDFISPSFGSPFSIAVKLAEFVDELEFGQLIYEYGTWIHISRLAVPNPINRIITIDKKGCVPGIVKR